MIRLKLRDLVHYTYEQLWEIEQKPIIVECDNGEVETIREEIILSWFLWEFHRTYPSIPHKKEHVMANITITPNTHAVYLSVVQKDAYLATRTHEYAPIEPYAMLSYKIYNNLYNFMSGELLPYSTSISILDYVEVLEHPEIAKVNEDIRNADKVTSKDIQQAYRVIRRVLETDTTLTHNALATAFKHGIVSIGQILQDLGPRGFVSDIDSYIFPKAIRTSFAYGLNDIADYIAESRTGTMSDLMTGDPMREAEYLNRLLQLSGSRVADIIREDCGTTTLTPWVIDSEAKLGDFEGIYYLNEETGLQEPIDPKIHKHLVGKEIQVRLIFNCITPHRDGVCAKCYGDLSYNLSDTDNIGHIAAIEFQSGQSQQILGFKHSTESVTEYGIYVDEVGEEFFEICYESSNIYLRPEIDTNDLILRVDSKSFRGLTTLTNLGLWDRISPMRMSRISEVEITYKGETKMATIAETNNHVYFPMEALTFLANIPHELDVQGIYTFKMNGWNHDSPIFSIPRIKFNVLEYASKLSTFIKGTVSKNKNNVKTINDFDNPIDALRAFHDMVDEQLRVSMCHLQVLILSACCEDPENGDYRLPLDKSKGVLTSHSKIMDNGALSLALGYQTQENIVFDPDNYTGGTRTSSHYDYFVTGYQDE